MLPDRARIEPATRSPISESPWPSLSWVSGSGRMTDDQSTRKLCGSMFFSLIKSTSLVSEVFKILLDKIWSVVLRRLIWIRLLAQPDCPTSRKICFNMLPMRSGSWLKTVTCISPRSLLLDLDYFKHLCDSSGQLNFTSLQQNGRMKKNTYSTMLYTSTNYRKISLWW